MGDWQPIETAPRDGTEFLAYGPEINDDGDDDGDEFIQEYDELICIACWRSHSGEWVSDGMVIYHLTHWMPLPAPPSHQ